MFNQPFDGHFTQTQQPLLGPPSRVPLPVGGGEELVLAGGDAFNTHLATRPQPQTLLNYTIGSIKSVVENAHVLQILQNYFNDLNLENNGDERLVIASIPQLQFLAQRPTVLCFDRIPNLFSFDSSKSYDLVTVASITKDSCTPCGLMICTSSKRSDYVIFFNSLWDILRASVSIFAHSDLAFLDLLSEYFQSRTQNNSGVVEKHKKPVHIDLYHFTEANSNHITHLFRTASGSLALTKREEEWKTQVLTQIQVLYLCKSDWEFNFVCSTLSNSPPSSCPNENVHIQFISYFTQTWMPRRDAWAAFIRMEHPGAYLDHVQTELIRAMVQNLLDTANLKTLGMEPLPGFIQKVGYFVAEYSMLLMVPSTYGTLPILPPGQTSTSSSFSSTSSTSSSSYFPKSSSTSDSQIVRDGDRHTSFSSTANIGFTSVSNQHRTYPFKQLSYEGMESTSTVFSQPQPMNDNGNNAYSTNNNDDEEASHIKKKRKGNSGDPTRATSSFITNQKGRVDVCPSCGDAKVNNKCSNKTCQKCCSRTDQFCVLTAHASMRLQMYPSVHKPAIQKAIDESTWIYLRYGNKKVIQVKPIRWVMNGVMFEDEAQGEELSKKYRLDKITEVMETAPTGEAVSVGRKRRRCVV